MPLFATLEGTREFAARFAGRVAAGHFRDQRGLLLSSIGIGTYLGQPDAPTDQAYTDASVAAVTRGANVIDTAINYRFQRSERSIGAALKKLAAMGYLREELVLCSKAGFLTPDGEMPSDAGDYFRREFVETGVLRPEDVAAGSHCMTPRYLEDQLARSLRNLGVECIDVFYLHNPETQLSDVPREEFRRRLRAAFEFLESAVSAGKIQFYGMATWNAFRQPDHGRDYVSLPEAVALAREVAGDLHHFRFVQLPFNLAMLEALVHPNQMLDGRRVPTLEAAQALGITVIASASLMQGQLVRGLPDFLATVLGLERDSQRALQFVRSTPGITTALVGMSHVEHVESNLELVSSAPLPPQRFFQLFEKAP